jgi:N4-gp56 family major capsid protein
MPGANTSTLLPLLAAYLINKVLEKKQMAALYDRFAQPYTIPVNQGDTAKWFLYENMPEMLGACDEGVLPPPGSAQRTEKTATVDQYIWWLPFTDKLKDLDMDSQVIQRLQVKLAQMANLSIDTIKGTAYCAGVNVVYAGQVAGRSSVEDLIAVTDLKLLQKSLKANVAEHVTSRVAPSTKVGTLPIREAYILIDHTDSEPHWDNVQGFLHASEYPSNDAMPNEYGSWKEFRIFTTQHAIVKASAGAATAVANGLESDDGVRANVYCAIAFGMDALGTVGLQAHNMEVIIKSVDSGGAENAGNQKGSIAIKTYDGEIILDEDYLFRYEHACEVVPS